jgi:hypothetical protein
MGSEQLPHLNIEDNPNKQSKKKVFLIAVFSFLLLSLPLSVYLVQQQPKISIPGLQFGAPKISTNGNGEDQLVDVPFLGQYIAAVYKYAVAVAGIIAVVMIIIAGFQWATSGGSADAISEAKKRISNAIIGLILTLSSYVILYTVNPELVSFKNLRVQYVQTKDVFHCKKCEEN